MLTQSKLAASRNSKLSGAGESKKINLVIGSKNSESGLSKMMEKASTGQRKDKVMLEDLRNNISTAPVEPETAKAIKTALPSLATPSNN